MLEPWTKGLTSSMLPDGICKSIAEEIGADNLLKLAVLVGGSTFYMPQAEGILRPPDRAEGETRQPLVRSVASQVSQSARIHGRQTIYRSALFRKTTEK